MPGYAPTAHPRFSPVTSRLRTDLSGEREGCTAGGPHEQPERDQGGVDTGLEEAHRGGVTQGVDGDVLAGDSRAGRRGPGHVQCQALLDGVGGQRVSVGAGEEGLAGVGGRYQS